ncbi:hypothetical protein ACFQ05_31840 [Amycolatopsis umgeniensis]|uniref:Uncharacterized protein n=1 Tax=Amycolatopsis umgeniensis TaxID=336628 RepID=A0A841ATR3_9PSEU|nr:hypothetical protein [Amycolatopsis umgeniensis]MBB5850377.1 hypothetical protein [Amycolatopsis umgeniensis]
MTTRICETRRRPGTHAGALRMLVSAELEKPPRVAVKPEAPAKNDATRYHFPRWNPRDRRVQRLRGWLSGATG